VEDSEGDDLVPFADFRCVLLTNTVAKTKRQTLGTSRVDIIEIEGNNRNILTNIKILSSSEVKFIYS